MSTLRRLAVFSTGRQDFGILRSTIALLRRDGSLEARLWAGGMHLQGAYGSTIEHVRDAGFSVDREIPFLDAGASVSEQTAAALRGVGSALADERPHALLLVGDRSETLAAAIAAVTTGVPVVHLHGGEETEGSLDNLCRHAITKLSHLHLVSHEIHARRVRQLGEHPASIVIVGAPGLDNMYRDDLPSDGELEEFIGGPLDKPLLLVTLHPTTLGDRPVDEVTALSDALEDVPAHIVITAPNADEGGEVIREHWKKWSAGRRNVQLFQSLGERHYWALLQRARAVVGNSSSGLIEAPAAGAAVLNVGLRQAGRLRYGTVYDVPVSPAAIRSALTKILEKPRPGPPDTPLYPPGPAAPRVVSALARLTLDPTRRKAFFDIDISSPSD